MKAAAWSFGSGGRLAALERVGGAVGRVADAVVMGTRLIQIIEAQPREGVAPAAAEFLSGIRQALDAQG